MVVDALSRAFQVPDLRRRIFFTLWMFLVFRLGAHVPVPGIDPRRVEELFATGTLFAFLDVFAGGALKSFSVFAMSILPYINASIIMQLLTIVVPAFERWAKEGDEGRKRLTQYTRYGTVLLALLQGIGVGIYLSRAGGLLNANIGSIFVVTIILTAGTTFLMWIGEQITEKGIGNGISLLIFAGIVSRLPSGTMDLIEYLKGGRISLFNVVLLAVIAVIVIAGVVWVNEGQRRIPVQYAKRVVGRKVYGGQSTHIPIRVNQGGVIPIIFAASILAFPPTIAQFVDHPIARGIANALGFGTALNTVFYAVLIIFFTYFYTAVIFNPNDVADNIKKYGGFIPGLRPGKPTAQYLAKVLERITLAGAIFLALIAVLPVFVAGLTNIPNIFFGGTALLIVVGVSLETMKQVEAHLLMRHYQGFMK